MFGLTSDDMTQAGGAPVLSGAEPEAPSLGLYSGQAHQSAAAAMMFSNGEWGIHSLVRDAQKQRAEQYKRVTGEELSDTYAFPDLTTPEVAPSWRANLYHSATGFSDAEVDRARQLDTEKKVLEYNTKNPGNPLPTAGQIIAQAAGKANDISAQAQEDVERTPGVNIPYLGKVTLPELVGTTRGMATLENPIQAATLVAGGPLTGAMSRGLMATGAIGNTIAARAASAFALNAGTQAAAQYAFAKPGREEAGLPFDNKAAAFNVLTAGLFGATLETAGAGAGHYFPATLPEAAKGFASNLSDIAAKDTATGKLAQELIAAKTPGEAAAASAAAPLATHASLLDRADPAPVTEVRGGMQAMERENVVEEMNPGLPWNEHTARVAAVQESVEKAAPLPGYEPIAITHIEDSLNAIRAEDAGKSLARGREPPSLLKFLADRGGVIDEGGELAAMNAELWHRDKPFQRRLVRDGAEGDSLPGMEPGQSNFTLDRAAEAAWEAGYFPEHADLRPTINDLLDKMGDELRGKKQFAMHDIVEDGGVAARENLRRAIHEAGADVSRHTNREVLDLLNDQQRREAEMEAVRRQALFEENLLKDETESIGAREHDMEQRFAALESQVAQMAAERAPAMPGTQGEMLAQIRPDDAVPLGDVTLDENGYPAGGMTIKDALEAIRDEEALAKAMTTCLL